MNRCIAYYNFEIDIIFNERLNQGINSIAQNIFDAVKIINCEGGKINAFNLELIVEEGKYKIEVTYCISGRFTKEEYELMEKLDMNEGE